MFNIRWVEQADEEYSKNYVCPNCHGFVESIEYYLAENETEPRYQCQSCQATFEYDENLHLEIIEKADSSVYLA